MTAQYVWSPVYVDALVERDTATQRLYAQQDANWNVTAVVDTTGAVQERYAYDAYGRPTDGNGNPGFLTPSWGSRATSAFSWIYLHQGGRFDTTSGLYNFRNRDYSPTLGRWMQQDPIAYTAGDINLYRVEGNGPTNGADPTGLDKQMTVILKWQEGPEYLNLPRLTDPPGEAGNAPIGSESASGGGTPIGIGGGPNGGPGPGSPNETAGIGEPSWWEGALPLWGSGRSAINAFQNGDWSWGLFHSTMAATDLFFAKSLLTAGGKLIIKAGTELGAGVLARVCKKTAAEAATALAGHHPIPMFLGGNFKQTLSKIPQRLHIEFHQFLSQQLRKRGLPSMGGVGGSAMDWRAFMLRNPGTQRQAFDAVLETSRAFDAKYGTTVTQDVWNSVIMRQFTTFP